mgnify:CR=1 FL=1
MASVIVDTNVALVANGSAGQADTPCMLKCLQELRAIRGGWQVLLDDKGLILQEYLKQKPYGFPTGPGDAFLIWVNDNQANTAHVRTVSITPLDDDPLGFAEFPSDPDLSDFDPADRKFVAVALASGGVTPILNATDTDWWIHRAALARNGVHVEFLCPHLMKDED